MDQTPTYPAYTAAEARNRETFLALMWALSYPGRIYDLPKLAASDEIAVFAQLGESLLDLETTYFTPNATLAAQLKLTVARTHPIGTAAYHFYPSVGVDDLANIAQASVGNALYPDEAATLFLGCTPRSLSEAHEGSGTLFTLQGPGIQTQQQVRVAGIPPKLWALRQRAIYPLGWDVFIVDVAGKVIGLPRTTQITVEE